MVAVLSARREYTIWCDHEACSDWFGDADATALKARRNARRAGWIRFGGLDLCPTHAHGSVRPALGGVDATPDRDADPVPGRKP